MQVKGSSMKLKKITFLITTIILIFSFSIIIAEDGQKNKPAETAQKEIVWYELDSALTLAKEKNKHIFIDFKTGWCGYCKKMDRDVFSKQEIISILNNDFIPVKVDGDSQNELEIDGYKITEQNLAKHSFKVTGYPTFAWLTPDGQKITAISGYRPVDYMKQALTFIKEYKYDSTKNENGEPIK